MSSYEYIFTSLQMYDGLQEISLYTSPKNHYQQLNTNVFLEMRTSSREGISCKVVEDDYALAVGEHN